MRIYTKSGDDGTTALLGGQRVSKSDPRIECYGTIDELNAALGLAAVSADPSIGQQIRRVQSDLMLIAAHLATPQNSPAGGALPPLDQLMVARLEMQIDAADAELPQLNRFILPGGCDAAARLHLARCICRRAERLIIAWTSDHPVPAIILIYINRLSDWLFTMARLTNHRRAVEEIVWEPPNK